MYQPSRMGHYQIHHDKYKLISQVQPFKSGLKITMVSIHISYTFVCRYTDRNG